ncbi:MAG: hypothetical protein RLZZ08_254 [Pseudomonadota bacterium]|jgi:hypothetical protein
MSEQGHIESKLEAFLEVLDDLIGETLAAGVPVGAVRRTLLAKAVYEFRADPADGCAALDHFRDVLSRNLARATK